ncbi:hypothetical protein ILUMI_08822 [Ignelater luminosus]|uniref:Uncharacterized protein n=1 Tax=Ignelater luminosus TaxID=2038154 RepID=A0A8K0D165_IGNLU|nr:hypothetical protein ILUMI_08822 [Ignelater luminosus]
MESDEYTSEETKRKRDTWDTKEIKEDQRSYQQELKELKRENEILKGENKMIKEKVKIIEDRVRRLEKGRIKNIVISGVEIEADSSADLKHGLEHIFGDQPVTVVPNERLDYTKGIISHRDLLNCPTEEIVEPLSEDGVVEARHMTRRNGVISIPVQPESTTPPGNGDTSSSNLSLSPPCTSPQKSSPSAVGTLFPSGTILWKLTMPTPSESGTLKSGTVIDKRKPNESIFTDSGSAREEDLSLIKRRV